MFGEGVVDDGLYSVVFLESDEMIADLVDILFLIMFDVVF